MTELHPAVQMVVESAAVESVASIYTG